jgi:hypothetical protein
MQGRMMEAEHLLAEARRAAQDPGTLYRIAYFSVYAGLVGLLAGDPIAAEREFRAGHQSLAEVGEKTNYTTVNALLARALGAQRRYPEAIEYTKASEEAARPNDVFANVTWRAVRANAPFVRAQPRNFDARFSRSLGFGFTGFWRCGRGGAEGRPSDVGRG